MIGKRMLYRQEVMFNRLSIDLPRATLSNWVLKSAKLLKTFYDRLHEYLIRQAILQADETPLNVIQDGLDTPIKSYMWFYQSAGHEPACPIVLYEYQATRAGQYAVTILQGFEGYLQADGFASYHALEAENRHLVGCMEHVRRKFDGALKALPKANRENKFGLAHIALRKFRAIYTIEKQAKDLTIEQRYALRREKSKPLMDDLKQWCDDHVGKTTKDALLGKAIRYTINQWDTRVRYLEDSNFEKLASLASFSAIVTGRPLELIRSAARFANWSEGRHSSFALNSCSKAFEMRSERLIASGSCESTEIVLKTPKPCTTPKKPAAPGIIYLKVGSTPNGGSS